ncbi:MAG: hypothetical protein JNG89_17640 [Planctomycetaceae bacterium]|nr:hypothetical protein [Planctomycetaceae bacterium]
MPSMIMRILCMFTFSLTMSFSFGGRSLLPGKRRSNPLVQRRPPTTPRRPADDEHRGNHDQTKPSGTEREVCKFHDTNFLSSERREPRVISAQYDAAQAEARSPFNCYSESDRRTARRFGVYSNQTRIRAQNASAEMLVGHDLAVGEIAEGQTETAACESIDSRSTIMDGGPARFDGFVLTKTQWPSLQGGDCSCVTHGSAQSVVAEAWSEQSSETSDPECSCESQS